MLCSIALYPPLCNENLQSITSFQEGLQYYSCPLHGKSSGEYMLYILIGVSPPPITLPATNRSIIIPCACHRHHWEQPNFRHISIYRSLLFGRSWRTYEHSLRHRLSTVTVPEDLVFNCQCSVKRLLICPLTIYF